MLSENGCKIILDMFCYCSEKKYGFSSELQNIQFTDLVYII